MKFNTIRFKLMSFAAIAILFTVAVMSVFVIVGYLNYVRTKLRSDSLSYLQAVSYTIAPAVEFDDFEAIDDILSLAQSQKHFLSVRLTTSDNIVVEKEFKHFNKEPFTFYKPFMLKVPVMNESNEEIAVLETEITSLGVMADARGNIWNILIVAGIILFFVLFVAVIFTEKFVKPILILQKTVQAIARGDFSKYAEVGSKDEIGDLAASFNAMINALRESRGELLATKTYVESIVTTLADALVVFDVNGIIKTVNKTTLALLGYDRGALVGESLGLIVKDYGGFLWEQFLGQIVTEKVVHNVDIVLIDKDGKEIPTSLSANILQGIKETGDVDLEFQGDIVLLARDMTQIHLLISSLQAAKRRVEEFSRSLEDKVRERTKELEDAQFATLNMMEDLDSSKNYIENVIAHFLDSFIVLNRDGTIQTVNKITLDLLGYKEFELLSQPFSIVTDHEGLIGQIIDKGEIMNIELFYKKRDGGRIPILFSGSVMKDKDQRVIGIVIVGKDITERKKAEESLRSYTKRIEAINKELDDFTYIVSHDLKEPLRSIDAFSKFVYDDYKDKLDEEAREYLERVRANTTRMQWLIEDLLEMSRIERRKNPFEEIDVKNIIEEVKLRLEYAIRQKKIDIVIAGELPRIYCDNVRFAEVFYNLISNAIKFADKPHSVIEIGCVDKDELFYEFYVKDNGPGIDEQYFHRIFEIFQRLGRREEHEGTGAGLTIVKKIIQMHRGEIKVSSKLGEGTTFYFTIPKKKESFLDKKKLGEVLTEKGIISKEQLEEALKEQESMGFEDAL